MTLMRKLAPIPPFILTGDVAQGPDCLLADVRVRRGEERDEVWHGARLHHELGLLGGAGGDVRQGPRGLSEKRKSRAIIR